MHYEISYKGLDRAVADSKAIEDIREYLGATQYNDLVAYAQQATDRGHVQSLNFSLGMFAGITGYPFHAFCRRYCLAAYREWMHAEPDPVLTDAEGFELPKVTA